MAGGERGVLASSPGEESGSKSGRSSPNSIDFALNSVLGMVGAAQLFAEPVVCELTCPIR